MKAQKLLCAGLYGMFASQQWQGGAVSGLFQLSSRAVAGRPQGQTGPASTPPAGAHAGLPTHVLPSCVIACMAPTRVTAPKPDVYFSSICMR